jgi:hypothetical protein
MKRCRYCGARFTPGKENPNGGYRGRLFCSYEHAYRSSLHDAANRRALRRTMGLRA